MRYYFLKTILLYLFFMIDTSVLAVTIDHFDLNIPKTGVVNVPVDIEVIAKDSGNNIYTGYTGYVFFQSYTDFSASLPAQGKAIQFKESDNGVLKISKGITFKRVGNQELMVTEAREDATGTATILISDSFEKKESVTQKPEPKTTVINPIKTIQENSPKLYDSEINVTNLTITRSGKYSILRWSIENLKDKKMISDYIIQYKDKGSSLGYTTYKKPVSKNMFFIIKGLSPNKEYEFKVSPVMRNIENIHTQSGEIFFGKMKAKTLSTSPTVDNTDIISAALMPSMIAYLKRSRDAARSAHLNTITTALGAYYSDTESYPKTSDSGCLPKELDADYLPKGIPTDPIEKRITPGCDGSYGTYAYRGIRNNTYGISGFVLGVKMENEIGGNSNLPIERITSDTILKPGSGDMYYMIY